MDRKSHKKSVHSALLLATQHHKMISIAKGCEVPYQSLRTFKQTCEMGTELVHRLAVWLSTHGYLEGYAAPIQPDHPPEEVIINAMAADLESLAANLRAPIPKETKARLFAERITYWYKSMEEYLKKVKAQG